MRIDMIEYEKAFTEVLEVLNYLPKEDREKIPFNILQALYKNKSKEYVFIINRTKPLKEQKLSKVTKAILVNFYRDYWATEYERKIIKEKQRLDLFILEENKRKAYNEKIKNK